MANDDVYFKIGYTDLRALAEERGWTYDLSPDGVDERVTRPDGTVAIHIKHPRTRPEKKPAPSVWMRSIRFHTYDQHPQEEGAIYLAREEDVENIITQRFAVREAAPRRAVRSPESQTVAHVDTGKAMTAENTPALLPTRRRAQKP